MDLKNYLYLIMIQEFTCIYMTGKKTPILKYMNSSITINRDLGSSCFSVSKVVPQ